ncbi:MAG: class I SAM-dependent methyltransferase, partial [Planctomycetes bacterium]|nr:class I SAM-dependent methyltransferase [Planctomycetota bacterium]
MIDIHALPFDQFQRYRLVADLVEQALGSKRGRVLDVGGRTELLQAFLKSHDIFLVDVEASDAKGLILGSGAALPFADDSFDAVCAFDTLEHVPVALRDDFVRECARVCRGYVFLAGPYDDPDVARSEELLQE